MVFFFIVRRNLSNQNPFDDQSFLVQSERNKMAFRKRGCKEKSRDVHKCNQKQKQKDLGKKQ